MTDLSLTIFWAIIGMLHLPLLSVPWVYWQKRNHGPIKVRRPRIFMPALLTLLANILHILLRNLFGMSSYCLLDILILCPLMISVCEAWFIFALALYIAYDKTKEQMVLYQAIRKSDDTDSIEKNIRSIRLYCPIKRKIRLHLDYWAYVVMDDNRRALHRDHD